MAPESGTAGTALVVGASSGFGRDLASSLLTRGWTVYAPARRTERLQDLEREGAHVLHMDVVDDGSVRRGTERIIDEQGQLDVAFANAGYGSYGAIESVPLEEVRRQYEVNVFGVARVVQAVLPHMRRRRSGRIVITASVMSHLSTAGMGWYASTKHALHAIVEALRQEVRAFGLHVVLIEPGMVDTEFGCIALAALARVEHPNDYRQLIGGFRARMAWDYPRAPGTRSTVAMMTAAASARRPKAVYRTTADAKLLPKLRLLLGSRLSDAVALRRFLDAYSGE